ncbi:MAG: hypothetical protein ACOX4G_03550 [Limnochordia bacterium]|jgi:hypothetical protein
MPACGWSSFPPETASDTAGAVQPASDQVRQIAGAGRMTCRREQPTFQGQLEDLEGVLVTLYTTSGRSVGGRIEQVYRDYLTFVSGGVQEAIPLSQITNLRVCPAVAANSQATTVVVG